MEISSLNMPMPALPDATGTEPENNDTRSSNGEQDDRSAPSSTPTLGSYVNETV